MALWLVRSGKHGEHLARFFSDGKIYLTWDGAADTSLDAAKDFAGMRKIVRELYPDDTTARVGNTTGQFWAFAIGMKAGDWVITPHKSKPAIAIGEVTGAYLYDTSAERLYRHCRTVKWLNQDIPRSNFDQDLLYSLGAIMTVCEVRRNSAEQRVRAMAKSGWKAAPVVPILKNAKTDSVGAEDSGATIDLERLARDQIAKHIVAKFKGHGMSRLIEAILKAQGYTTYLSPEGPDKGIDILAAPGALGFGEPRLCVQVKSGDSPVDLPTLNQLIGAMQNVHAQHGLLVSWGGFKSSVEREIPTQFFRVRTWDQDTIIDELLASYDKLDAELRAELPFKRIWSLTTPDEE
jgi:restriction system protein